MRLLVIGNVGSDAGYWYHDASGWHHVGGWAPEAMLELRQALSILGETTKLKTPDLANVASKGLVDFVQKQMAGHVKEGDIVVIQ